MPEAEALFQEACRLDDEGDTGQARQAYLNVLAHDLSHAGALARLGRLLFAAGYTSAARTTYTHAVKAHPEDPAAHVNLAHLLRESDALEAARTEYAAALACDPACHEAHQGLSYLLDGMDDEAAARHRDLGFAGRALTTVPYRGRGTPIRVLRLVSARGGNIPTRHLLDDRVFETHSLVVEYAGPCPALPPHAVVFNTIGDADRCDSALRHAARILTATSARIVNPPERILATARVANLRRLSLVEGVIAPHAATLPRSAFSAGVPQGFALPLLLRSPGFHTGQHFHRVAHAADLPDVLEALPGDPILALQYLDAAGADGSFRKYRVMLIGSALLPVHLAISHDWKVHYYTAGMAAHPEHRAEEARFLADMGGVLGPRAMNALSAIEELLGLDYAGVDFALDPDGRLLLFEANATMTLVPPPADAVWTYRLPALARAIAATRSLLAPQPCQQTL